uniref:Uncharacterized protein n=1 Tax=Kalanchoe fedtschenkoi TaxID=63787 RepID=A0A7N0U5U8_KALFE
MAPNTSSSNPYFSSSSLHPPPYPALILLAILAVFLAASWRSSYESAREAAGAHLGWALLATPVALIFLARLVSSVENAEEWVFGTPLERQRRSHLRGRPGREGGGWGTSPWAVGAAILVLLLLVQFQSSFHDAWFG